MFLVCWVPPLRAERTSTWSPSTMALVPRSNSSAAPAALTSANMAATSLLVAAMVTLAAQTSAAASLGGLWLPLTVLASSKACIRPRKASLSARVAAS